ncbi:MAG: hypothetical protein IPL65_16510 [Lewinellaceae bacterium]|nr:hypothetical protein [Lewinellaceae bacterium]
MFCKVVFNLYPFSENHYLPSANIVQTDAQGILTHLVQKASPATIGAYGITANPVLTRLFDTVDRLTPKSLEAKFKPPKARNATPLALLLSQAETKAAVERYLHRELDQLLNELVRHQYPLTLDAERKTLAKDVQINYATEELIPHLSFRKTDHGVEYRFQLGTETEQWAIHQHEVLPLTNTDPAWLLVGYVLFKVPGINGNMVRPFRNKEVVHIPPDKTKTYFQTFIARAARRARIEAEGFEVQERSTLLHTRLEIVENVLARQWLIKPVFVYEGAEFTAGDQRNRISSVSFPEGSDAVQVQRISRDLAAEQQQTARLLALSLEEEGHFFKTPAMDAEDALSSLQSCMDWLALQEKKLLTEGFFIETPEVAGRKLLIASPKIAVTVRADTDWFDVNGDIQVGQFRFPFAVLVPYLRKGERYYPLTDDLYFVIPESWFTRYTDLANSIEPGAGDQMQLKKSLFPLLQAAGIADDGADGFPLIDPDTVDYLPSDELKATLRPYQLRGVRWLVGHYRQGFGACLADDMGLGKNPSNHRAAATRQVGTQWSHAA